MTAPIVLWGASGHARVVADIVRLAGEYEIVGFLDDIDPKRKGTMFLGVPILGGSAALADLHKIGVRHCLVAFGDGAGRLRAGAVVRDAGMTLAMAIHPRAVVAADVVVGLGTVVAAGAVVNPGVRLGESVIVNTSASIDHDCDIGDGAHVCPGAHLAGRVRVGRTAWVGIGAAVIDGITIGDGALVGAGAVVVRDVPAGMLAYGVPARVARSRRADGGAVSA